MTDPLTDKTPGENWERTVLEKLATGALHEQRRARRWGIFFKSLGFIYLFALLFVGFGWIGKKEAALPGKHTALVELSGVIAADSEASAEKITSGLQEAFKDKRTQGIVLRINSPGGSPVQAGYINDEIRRLRAKYPAIPLYAVVEDVCASGGYYVAVAADKIFVDKASIVGSIGVLMDGFGFVGTLDKLGIERRLITAGREKGFLDPFSPVMPQQKDHAEKMLSEIHGQFMEVVKQGRGQRLKDNPDLFTGLVWTGQRSVELGLADALGNVDYVAREIIKADEVVDFTDHETFIERFARRLGAGATEALLRMSGTSTATLR
jgi:protease-4